MQRNGSEENDVLVVYDKRLYSYLHGDVGTYDYYLDDDFHFIHSTNNEELRSREETTRFFAATDRSSNLFTTKPTGQGIGLGLSLSYDIIKAHGGNLKVESKEGEGSTFSIQLPLP